MRTKVIAVAGALIVLGAAGCGETSDPPARAALVTTATPATTFAPLVLLDRRERLWPMSADTFLERSGLEWVGGPCPLEQDVTRSGTWTPKSTDPTPPPLNPRRLGGRDRPYRVRPMRDGCSIPRSRSYTSDQPTRPFGSGERPQGLYPDEGFALDIVTEAQEGEHPTGPDGSVVGVPAYYTVAHRGGEMRISYWLLFGRQERPEAAAVGREGDWEQIDVVLLKGDRPSVFRPVAVALHQPGRAARIPWTRAELAGQGATHPVVHLTPGVHTPRASGRCHRCAQWRTWRAMRSAKSEPWWGYGGGWGAIGEDGPTSGPPGPSPHGTNSSQARVKPGLPLVSRIED